ncbi:MAG: hypothetical protein IH991_03155 [Planctomycetes bacterium]|nr:hypothetical protein [Planctomycetota bacterium]
MATEPPKRKRRWFRFSLKTFVVLLTVFCVWLGLLAYRVNKQKEAVQWVRDHRGKVYYDFQWDEVKESSIDDAEPPGPDWLRNLIGVDYFSDVAYVYIPSAKVDDIGPLRDLTDLRVDLSGTQVSDLSPFVKMKGVTIYLDSEQQVAVPEELKGRVRVVRYLSP